MNLDTTYIQEISGQKVYKTLSLTPSTFLSVDASGNLRVQSSTNFLTSIGAVPSADLAGMLVLKADVSAMNAGLNLKATTAALSSHTGNLLNPHTVTKAQVGLANVSNLAPANLPISNATQLALDGKMPASRVFGISDIQSLEASLASITSRLDVLEA